MTVTQDSELVSFPAGDAVAVVRDLTDEQVHLCVEYTAEDFRVLYADDLTMALYGDEERMLEHFAEVHGYVHVDFTEMDLFEELMVGAGDVRAFATYMDNVTLVRVLTGEGEGFFATLDPGADVTGAVEAVRGAVVAE